MISVAHLAGQALWAALIAGAPHLRSADSTETTVSMAGPGFEAGFPAFQMVLPAAVLSLPGATASNAWNAADAGANSLGDFRIDSRKRVETILEFQVFHPLFYTLE